MGLSSPLCRSQICVKINGSELGNHYSQMQPHLTTEDISSILKGQHLNTMKTAQLTSQIKYVSLSDDEGTFGLMILQTSNPKIREIHSEEEFVQCYDEFSSLFSK